MIPMTQPNQMFPVLSATKNDVIADVNNIPSIPRFNTPERSVNNAPNAAKMRVVAMAIESANDSNQMFEFIV